MKYYFSSYWYLDRQGTYGVKQIVFAAGRINIREVEARILHRYDNLERVVLLTMVKLTKKEYELNKALIK